MQRQRYSPDLNPIEKLWFAIKHAIRKALQNFWPDINSAIDFSTRGNLTWVSYSLLAHKQTFLDPSSQATRMTSSLVNIALNL
ncbi:hypothetical protein [Wolbachia endosymbiont (group A) of Sphaerophoria taeniata]|uniref:hypothetical protein n=1 Tax=Wolbachia endosymbiont (group A) of Sphaerophoria taeniata TaxID=2954057 RepID=UPI0022279A70|nr:hypothetical protein [Wolbachia endosymbiont (group A) of Sphaerophoria taeniata]